MFEKKTISRVDREHSKFKKVGDPVAPESSLVQVAIVEGGGSSGPTTAQGTYNVTPPVLSDTQESSLQLDVNGNLKTTTKIDGVVPVINVLDPDPEPIQLVTGNVELKSEHLTGTFAGNSDQYYGMRLGGWTSEDHNEYRDVWVTLDDHRLKTTTVLENNNLGVIGISQDLYIPTPTGLNVINSNLFSSTLNNTNAFDAYGFRSGTIEIVSAAGTTATTVAFEALNEATGTFVPFNVIDLANPASGTSTAYSIAASTTRQFYFPVPARYIKARLTSAVTTGSIKAITYLNQNPFTYPITHIGNITSLTTVSSVTSAALAKSAATLISSSAITATATSTASAIGNVQSISFEINVTAVSGTSPTFDADIQGSRDNVNWNHVYSFQRITAIGNFRSPPIEAEYTHFRVVQTIGGTTPSFTRAVNVLNSQVRAVRLVKLIDRSINPNTLNSVSPTIDVEKCKQITLSANCSAVTTGATIAIQVSEDGIDWMTTGNTLGTIVGISQVNPITSNGFKYARAIVTAAGTGNTLKYLTLKGIE